MIKIVGMHCYHRADNSHQWEAKMSCTFQRTVNGSLCAALTVMFKMAKIGKQVLPWMSNVWASVIIPVGSAPDVGNSQFGMNRCWEQDESHYYECKKNLSKVFALSLLTTIPHSWLLHGTAWRNTGIKGSFIPLTNSTL